MILIQSNNNSAALLKKMKLRVIMLIMTTTHECEKFAALIINEAIELNTALKLI